MARLRFLYAVALYVAACTVVAVPLLAAAPPGQLEKAVEAQRERVAAEPGNAAALNDLGNLLVEVGAREEAEEAYRRAMEINPERPEPPFNLALLLTDRRPREARRLLKGLLKQHKDHAWGYYHLGTLQQARGNRSHALRSYRRAFRLDPRLTDPRFNPHVLDNGLATAAMLEAFSEDMVTTARQRQYAEPNRVSGLLLSPLSSMSEESGKPMMGEKQMGEASEELETEEVLPEGQEPDDEEDDEKEEEEPGR